MPFADSYLISNEQLDQIHNVFINQKSTDCWTKLVLDKTLNLIYDQTRSNLEVNISVEYPIMLPILKAVNSRREAKMSVGYKASNYSPTTLIWAQISKKWTHQASDNRSEI